MSDLIGKFFIHKRTCRLYKVINIARNANNPFQKYVVYEQLQNSVLMKPGTSIPLITIVKLPRGSVWIRNLSEWNKSKFIKI
jgi:hypothetical protein